MPPRPSRPTSIVLDSNLLLLLVVGLVSPAAVRQHKRLERFTQADFVLLQQFVSTVPKVITTRHVLTETSNLAAQSSPPLRDGCLSVLSGLILQQVEVAEKAALLVKRPEYMRFGLTDTAIASLDNGCILLTEDRRLAAYLVAKGRLAWTLDDLRPWATRIR